MRAVICLLKFKLSILLPLLVLASAWGQGTKADYERIGRLRSTTSNKVFRTKVQPNWFAADERLWYRVDVGPREHKFIYVDLDAGKRELAFDHRKVAEQLTRLSGKSLTASRLPFNSLHFDSDGSQVTCEWAGKSWRIRRADSLVSEATETEPAAQATTRLKAIRPSENKGGEMHVTFVNTSDGPIRTIWIDRSGNRVPYESIAVGGSLRQHTFVGHVWLVVNQKDEPVALFEASAAAPRIEVDGETIDLPKPPRRRTRRRSSRSATSPDGRFRALSRGDSLLLLETKTKQETLLARISEAEQHFEDGEFYWSPDSRYFVALQTRPGQNRKIHMIESSPKDQLQPKLHTHNYAKPGDRIRQRRPRLFNAETQQEVEVSDAMFPNPWRLDRFQWRDDSSEFVFRFNQRGHQVMRVIGVNASTGAVRAVIDETVKTFIDYTNKTYLRTDDAADEMLWMSERDGWNHLYLYAWSTGKVKNQITKGKWVVRGVERVDAEKRQIWFLASGLVPGQDPYYVHDCRINFDGTGLTVLTSGDGTHAIEYSPTRKYLLDRYSRVDLPTVTTVRRVKDGKLVCELERGDWSRLRETGWRPPTRFVAKGRDGETDIYGVVYLPMNFSADRKYPVIEYIYAGPHDSFAPKRFSTYSQRRAMSELGFIVVQLDGMGTSNRSKAFHDVCWKNLGDSGFPDRILWMQAAAKEIPQMDLERVGIYGGSAGGQSALRALLAHGDFYTAAVADCGCHDNRMDKIWWNEQWMGWPLGPHYEKQSNVTNAHRLRGDLLLIVGELDRNVDPASTMQVVDALIKADKDFEMLVVPGAGHGIGSGRYGMRRTRDFFVRRLHGVEPRRSESSTPSSTAD